MYRVNNSLTDFHYRFHRARPLRVRNSNGCMLLTDKQYKISEYSLGYLRKPTEITLDNPYDEYEDFEDIIMPEIIKIAAQMYLENKKDCKIKYSTTNELNADIIQIVGTLAGYKTNIQVREDLRKETLF